MLKAEDELAIFLNLIQNCTKPQVSWVCHVLLESLHDSLREPVSPELSQSFPNSKSSLLRICTRSLASISFNFDSLQVCYTDSSIPGPPVPRLFDLVQYVVWLENRFHYNLVSIKKEARVRTLITLRYIQSTLIDFVEHDLGAEGLRYCRDFASDYCLQNNFSKESVALFLSMFSSNGRVFRSDDSDYAKCELLPTLIIPAAGRSSRFPNMKPKWMLTQPNGKLMIVDCLEGLDHRSFSKVVIGLLKEHISDHCSNSIEDVISCFSESPFAGMVEVVVIPEQTCDQTRTVEMILSEAAIAGPIVLKDCDNSFRMEDVGCMNGVAFCTLSRSNEGEIFNVASKGYVDMKSNGVLKNIIEKSIISSTFACGSYRFQNAGHFLSSVDHCRLMKDTLAGELSISDVIWKMMLAGSDFAGIPCDNYKDWGTLQAWRQYCSNFKTLFIDIDGTLVRNSGQYFGSRWGTTDALEDNVSHLQKMHAAGFVTIILTTSRTESFRDATLKQLKRLHIPFDDILFGLPHAQRVVINDFAPTNPFPSALAINLDRNSNNLASLL